MTEKITKTDEEFEGVNFHYMTPKARAVTMGNLFDYLNNAEYKPVSYTHLTLPTIYSV